mgnify:CR=1 FL=1
MAQRESGYERKARDAYMTPRWVTDVLLDDLERQGLLPVTRKQAYPTVFSPKFQTGERAPLAIWEPAAGTGQMARAMSDRGYEVTCSDIQPEPGVGFAHDFTVRSLPVLMPAAFGAIVTNPPYDQAESFVANALDLVAPAGGVVAMLLKVDWDSAKTRRRFFADCPAWCRKLVLLDRIHWFDPEPGKAGPSENHAWYVWSFGRHAGLGASIGYLTAPDAERQRLRAARKAAKVPDEVAA